MNPRKDPSEHHIQSRLINELQYSARRDSFYFAVPNAGKRSFLTAQKMKAEGMVSGIADLCFMLPGGITKWLEMKTRTGRLSDTQLMFRGKCIALGHEWAMARSVDEAIEQLRLWGVIKPETQR